MPRIKIYPFLPAPPPRVPLSQADASIGVSPQPLAVVSGGWVPADEVSDGDTVLAGDSIAVRNRVRVDS
jgi:hypothetical protein